jgi:hypothetical protein
MLVDCAHPISPMITLYHSLGDPKYGNLQNVVEQSKRPTKEKKICARKLRFWKYEVHVHDLRKANFVLKSGKFQVFFFNALNYVHFLFMY